MHFLELTAPDNKLIAVCWKLAAITARKTCNLGNIIVASKLANSLQMNELWDPELDYSVRIIGHYTSHILPVISYLVMDDYLGILLINCQAACRYV